MCKTEYVKRNPNRLRLIKLLLPGLVLFINCQQLHGQQSAKTELIELPYHADGSSEQFEVALDQIGILPGSGSSLENINITAKSLGGNIAGTHGSIFIIQRAPAENRLSLAMQAREVRDTNPDILQAGLVLYPLDSSIPIIINDELVIRFKSGTTEKQIRELADRENILPVMQAPLVKDLWIFRLKQDSSRDVVEIVKSVASNDQVVFTHPNIFAPKTSRQAASIHQWHHVNTGQGGPPVEMEGTVDADVDSDLAWHHTQGNAAITIAVIDASFDLNHPDLANNAGGMSFAACTDMTDPGCASTTITENAASLLGDHVHGTAVAGLAIGSRGTTNNFSGSCPQCRWIPIQQGEGAIADSLAIQYAGEAGARIVSNSWGYDVPISPPGVVTTAIEATAATGAVMFWAMSNEAKDDCATTIVNGKEMHDISADPHVIAISAISNQEQKVNESGYGDCMSLLAPSHRDRGPDPNNSAFPGVEFSGSLNIATTDRDGPGDVIASKNAGYNDERAPNSKLDYDPNYCPQETGALNYTLCFGGTSAATPIAAGIGGLVLSADDTLTPEQVKYLLQDTADKAQDSIGKYSKATGKSEPGGPSRHGYGRINAYEAVHVVAPVSEGYNSGLGGTDIFIRDNRLDWGNTKQLEAALGSGMSGSNVKLEKEREFIPHYQSVDIKVDAPDSAGAYRNAPTSVDFDAFDHENPISGALNKVYVRLRNRGPRAANDVRVKLHWAMAGTALPSLPDDFWTAWPNDSSISSTPWHTVGSQVVPVVGYSGASIAAETNNGSVIVSFDFTGPALDPSLPAFRHHCLFAVIDSDDDPVGETRLIPDLVTPTNNNVTHRNLAVQDATTTSANWLMVRNPFPRPIITRLKLKMPKRWKASLSKFGDEKPFELGAGEEVPVMIEIFPVDPGEAQDVEVRQEVMFKETFQPFGGFLYRFTGK